MTPILGLVDRLPPLDGTLRGRLAALGWLDDDTAAEALHTVWAGPDPDGAMERLVVYLEAAANHDMRVLEDADATRRIAHLAGSSRELMRQLTVRPAWLIGAEPDDLVGRSRSRLAQVAGDDLAGLIDVEEGGRLLAEMADRLVTDILGTDPVLAVIAFGKWGGCELNYWSDIDLTFVFDDGEAGDAGRAAAEVMRRLAGTAPEGVVLHADANLRPEGSRGPLARSLDAYLSYYQRWAQPWEFQALLKVRHAAGRADVGGRFIDMVAEVLWPETIDPDAIRSLRALKARHETRAVAGDLKRAPGGIRDIEFAVQMLQLVHGRFDSHLRSAATLDLLGGLAEGGYVGADDAQTLSEAYRWLRAAEHRIQLWDLRQTHLLPSDDEGRERLSRAMGYRDDQTATARERFEADLIRYRSTVRRIHEDLYFRPLLEAFAATPATGLSREGAERRLAALGFDEITKAARTFESLTSGLSRRSRLMQQMLPLILDWLADSPHPDLGLDQLRLLAANVADHAELITTLHDRPVVGRRLAYLLGSSGLLGQYLDRIPEFVPRLDDDVTLTELRPHPELTERLRRRIGARPGDEAKTGTLRRFARRQLLRVAVRDLLDLASVEASMDDLTAGADAAVEVACDLAGAAPGFAVIAMGRWGGRELSYGSDLDLLYVYGEPHDAESAQSVAVGLRRLLAEPAQDGVAWELDANLRPEGRSGPLVRSLASYRAYYERWAQTWEFQALIKARPVGGHPHLGAAFLDTIEPFVWRDPVEPDTILDLRRMKARIEKERIPPGENPDFHLKLGPGGMVDTEFVTQLLQLRHGGADPGLRVTPTLHALELLSAAGHLDSRDAEILATAYRFCTQVRNRLFLQVGRRLDSLPTDVGQERRLALSLGYRRRGDLREEYRRLTRRAREVFERRFYA